jgi:hypothetical protein
LTIAGVALTGAGYVAQNQGARAASRARDSALAAERTRQAGLDQQAAALNTQSQDRYQNFEGKQDERRGELAEFFTQGSAQAAPETQGIVPASDNNVVVREVANQRQQQRAATDKQGEALANLRSFGDLLGETGRLQGRDAAQIGQIGGFKRGSNNVLALELNAAQNAGAGARGLGEALQGIGGLAIQGGLRGPGAGGLNIGSPFGGR